MFDFFSQVLGYIEMGFRFLFNTITSLIMAVGFLGTSLSFPQLLVGYMPPIIGSAILVFIAIYVIRFLIGR